MSQQRSNNRHNEGERGRCGGQSEKMDVRKTGQEHFRVFRDTVNGLFKGTFWALPPHLSEFDVHGCLALRCPHQEARLPCRCCT